MSRAETYEYVVSPRKQLRFRLRRIGVVVGYVLFGCLLLLVGLVTRLLAPMLAFVPLAIWILVWLTWRYVNVEYEYSITSGVLTLTRIYGGRNRRRAAQIRIREISLVAPFSGEYIRRAEQYAPEESLDFSSDLQGPDVYIALYETDKARRGILYFDATDKALRLLKEDCSSVVIGDRAI